MKQRVISLPVTLADISEQTGVDSTSISRILRGMARQYRISTERETLVRQTAKRLRYRPNLAARSTTTGKFGNVAMLTSTRPGYSDLHADLIRGCHDVLAAQHLNLTIAQIPDDQLESSEYIPRILSELSVDGLLVNYRWHTPPRLAELIEQFNVPAIWLGSKREQDAVYSDMLSAYTQATEQLIELGHRRITLAIVAEAHHFQDAVTDWHYSEQDSVAGFTTAMTRVGLEARIVRGTATEIGTLLATADRPTAVVAKGINSATIVWLAAAQAGLNVPRDVSLLAVCAESQPLVTLPFTQAVAPVEGLGRAGVELLMEKIQAPAQQLPARVLPVTWLPGATTGGVRL